MSYAVSSRLQRRVAEAIGGSKTMKQEKAERRFRRELRELEAIRSKLSDSHRREVNAARRHLRIHNWWHYAPIIGAIHRKAVRA